MRSHKGWLLLFCLKMQGKYQELKFLSNSKI